MKPLIGGCPVVANHGEASRALMASWFTRKPNGFSVAEMLVVLAIGGILTAIAIPAFMAWAPKYRVNGAARQVFSDLMAAKARAVAEGNPYVVTFDTTAGSYTIHDNDDADDPPVQDPGEGVRTVVIGDAYPGIGFGYVVSTNPDGEPITNAVTFTGSPPKVTFLPSGLANKMGAVYLIPTGASTPELQRCITVLLTGRVRMYNYTGTGWE